jgi:hypothetical protein
MKYLFVFLLVGLVSCGDEAIVDETDNEQNDKKWSLNDKEMLKKSCLNDLSIAEELKQVEYSKESKDEFCSCTYGIVVFQYDSIEEYDKVSENKTLFKEVAENACLHLLICKEDGNQGKNDGFDEHNLDLYGIGASIMIPNETAGIGASFETEIIHDDGDFKWQISAGRNFNLFIEDYGDDQYRMPEFLRKLESQGTFKTEIIQKKGDYVIYKRELNLASGTRTSYHLYGVKYINNIYYEIKNKEEGDSRIVIDLLKKSFLSFKAI